MSSHNHNPVRKHADRDSDDVGTVWIGRRPTWVTHPTPMNHTVARYEGARVTTEQGPGVIRTLTGRSVTIDLDAHRNTTDGPISIVRGTFGWDRFVNANTAVFS